MSNLMKILIKILKFKKAPESVTITVAPTNLTRGFTPSAPLDDLKFLNIILILETNSKHLRT